VNSALGARGLLALHFTFGTSADRVANGRARRVVTLPAALRVAVFAFFAAAAFAVGLGLTFSFRFGLCVGFGFGFGVSFGLSFDLSDGRVLGVGFNSRVSGDGDSLFVCRNGRDGGEGE
jgi:hypothetical protein